uniref:CST complex subunit CTC1 n=1 Tax=Schistosoma mansoni TaxID=6183 RepID=A0A3Q0KRT0_SCHMA
MSCAVDIYDSGPHFKWITRNSIDMNGERSRINNDGIGYNQFLDSIRFTIQDLVQQESCIGSSNYPVDKPSRLVQIECRKPGCRCVLKNERALAMKIVPGITLVQAEWLLPNSVVSNGEKSRSHHSSQHAVNNTSNNKVAYNQSVPIVNQMKSSYSHSVVLTSCCPSWFELVRRNVIGPSDNGPQICPEVPVWSSCKAVWLAKPKFILLRKDTQCLFATNTQSLTMSSTELLKKDDRSTITLDADNIGILRPGTVLQLIDCRSCRLVHKEDQISYRLSARHRSKPVSMLQCAIVGGKALAALASSITNLSSQDALNWFNNGPRLVYLSLASKSIMCSPVKTTSTININTNYRNHNKNSSHIKLPGNETDYNIFDNGVHSILSLLSTYRLPLITRPVVGLHSSEWFLMGKYTNHSSISNSDSINMHSLLQIFSCHHGDLIFLEPLSDCTKSIYQNESSNEGIKSRFFVVTTDMLLHHNFLVADSQTCQAYQQQLEIHAFRVSHFLAACHPVQGLTYIIKHLEDITHSSNTGPSYIPLTRTLGPITSRFNTIAIQSAISSIAAIASLTMHEELNDIPNDSYQLNEIQSKILNHLTLYNHNNPISTTTTTTTNTTTTTTYYHNSSIHNPMHRSSIDNHHFYHSANCLTNTNLHTQSSLSSSLFTSEMDEMNALCDEIEDIYYYVRNGHFPMQSHSLSSLLHHSQKQQKQPHPHHHHHEGKNTYLNHLSAPISPYLNKFVTNTTDTTNNTADITTNNRCLSTKTTNNKLLNNECPIKTNHLIDNKIINIPMKITSKAPVLLIRPKPYHDYGCYGINENERKEITQLTSTVISTNQQTTTITTSTTTTHNNNSNVYGMNYGNYVFPETSVATKSCHQSIQPLSSIRNDHDKLQVSSHTFTPITTINNNNHNNNSTSRIDSSMAFTPFVYSSTTCHESFPHFTTTTATTTTYECERVNFTVPSLVRTNGTGYYSTQNITKLDTNNHNSNAISCTYSVNHSVQQPIHSMDKQSSYSGMLSSYCSYLPGLATKTTTTCCSHGINHSLKPLFTTSALNISSSKQNCIYHRNENKTEECIYDEPKEEYDSISTPLRQRQPQQQPQQQHKTICNVSNYSTYDYGYSLSSPKHHDRHHLSLSSSHIHPSISSRPMYERDHSVGNVWNSSFSVNNHNNNKTTNVSNTTNINKSSTAFHSISNMFNDKVTSAVNCIQIIPSNVIPFSTITNVTTSTTTTTTISKNNNNVGHYFTSQDQPSCMTTSFRHQSAQNSSSSIQQPPSMPLLYPLPVSTNHTSRLYQSTIISPSIDRKQIIPRPSYKQVTPTTNFDFSMHHYHNHSTIPSPLSTMLLLQSPKLKRTELTNSSPDTGIGIESTYDQQTTTCTGGSFTPLNTYHHSLSSSNMAVWSPSQHHCQQFNRQDSMTTPSTMNNHSISYDSSPDKHFNSCKLTTFPVQNNHLDLITTTTIITTTTTTTTHNHISSRNQQYAYQF